MSDTAASAESAATSISIGIAQQYVKDLSFESPGAPKAFMEPPKQPNINVNFNVGAENVKDDIYEVVLTIEINADIDKDPVFIAELTYAGICQVKSNSSDATQQALLIEVPRQLFPFARAIVANVIRDGGFPPLLLNPIDFNQFFREYQKNAAAQAGKA